MKIVLLFCSFLVSNFALADQLTSEAILANQHQIALTEFSAKLKDETLQESASGCPQAGFKLVNGVKAESGTLMSAKSNIGKLGVLATAQAKTLSAAAYCGSCKQTVYASQFVVTRPAKIKQKTFCDNRPTTSFEADFQSDKEAENYSQNILNKKNQEGERLYAACPNPCSFSVYAAKRTLPNGKVRSTMTVNCGQPRSSGLLFAKYNYTYGTAVQWSCQK